MFKENHIKIFRNVFMSVKLKNLLLVFPSNFAIINEIMESIELEAENAEINGNAVVGVLRNCPDTYGVKYYDVTS